MNDMTTNKSLDYLCYRNLVLGLWIIIAWCLGAELEEALGEV